MPDTVLEARRHTVQEFEARDSAGIPAELLWMYGFQRADLLPVWGDPSRDRVARETYRSPYNGMVQGAFAGLIKRVISTPFELKGGDRSRKYYQDLLVNAQFGDFGGGWRGYLSRLLLDFLTLDFGGVTEIIGPGDPTRPIAGKVLGIAHLDSLRCTATGNPEFPILYWSRKSGKLHRLHHTRVARLVDMPDGDEWARGLGLSAFSRIIATAQQLMLMSKYGIQRLDDLPPAGLVVVNGVRRGEWTDQRKLYEMERQKDGADTWANVMVMESLDPSIKAEVNLVSFSNLPEHFNPREYYEILVNALALQLGVDPQDIWPLTGATIGTGTQSEVLASKARGKMFGDILSVLERFINWYILPEDMEFQFQYQDDEADKNQADIAQAQVATAQTLLNVLGSSTDARNIVVKYLVDVNETFRDALTDDAGNLIELTDDDPKPDLQPPLQELPEQENVLADGTPAGPAGTNPAVVDDNKSTGGLRDLPGGLAAARKDIQATRLDFEDDVVDLLKTATHDDLGRQRFGIVFRALIRKYGQKAYEDGLAEGGVESPPDDDDLATIARLVGDQSAYVTAIGDALFKGGATISDYEGKATLWFNKSIMPFRNAGIMSADQNGMYEFAGSDGAESCATCSRLKGQVHRFKDWVRKQLRPREDTSNFECGGWRCEHLLVKTRGRARGGY